ncbi:MAG: nucleotidyl transferase AbiEii/AbiGii toxin family protein [Candidatus Fimousia sp.]|nr:nucleotidyl transferase AbiEii/AbiGii toxin family protein [Eubacterium sp.]MCI6995270.1 nucleotidyl transferase AbiEii/AbiGii toxin family protein [Eubacterium sp.]
MEYLHNDKERFREAINLAVYQTGISSEAVEKDYYVTMILKKLAENLSFVVFKGGTSLSKCHQVIKRFSEDIDVTIDMSLSQGQKKKVKEVIVEIVETMGLKITNLAETRRRRDYNRYVIAYESALPENGIVVQPAVLVETSYTAVAFPTVLLPVSNYIGKMMEIEAPEFVQVYGLAPFEMKVQGLDRTLVDKVFAVCDYYLQDKVKKHSRHIYDIYKLLPLVPQDEEYHKLVQEVRKVRKDSPVCPSARDNVDIPALLRKIIKETVYRADYRNLTEGLLEEKISYEIAIQALESIAEGKMFENE